MIRIYAHTENEEQAEACYGAFLTGTIPKSGWYNIYRKRCCDKRSALSSYKVIAKLQDRHLAEWRSCFILTVTIKPKICNVMMIGIMLHPLSGGVADRLPLCSTPVQKSTIIKTPYFPTNYKIICPEPHLCRIDKSRRRKMSKS